MESNKSFSVLLLVSFLAFIIALAGLILPESSFPSTYPYGNLTDIPQTYPYANLTGIPDNTFTGILSTHQNYYLINSSTWHSFTELNFTMVAGHTYYFKLSGLVNGTFNTVGVGLSVYSLATFSHLAYRVCWNRGNVQAEQFYYGKNYDTVTMSTFTSPYYTDEFCNMEGFIKASSNGTLFMRYCSGVSAQNHYVWFYSGFTLFYRMVD
jgi:hypothetical protein